MAWPPPPNVLCVMFISIWMYLLVQKEKWLQCPAKVLPLRRMYQQLKCWKDTMVIVLGCTDEAVVCISITFLIITFVTLVVVHIIPLLEDLYYRHWCSTSIIWAWYWWFSSRCSRNYSSAQNFSFTTSAVSNGMQFRNCYRWTTISWYCSSISYIFLDFYFLI